MSFRFMLWLGLWGGLLLNSQAGAAESGFKVESGLASYQVYQRSPEGTADVALGGTSDQAGTLKATVHQEGLPLARFEGKDLGKVGWGAGQGDSPGPAGRGPYRIELELHAAEGSLHRLGYRSDHVLVGDLWLLAGQSNMEGVGNMVEVEAPSDGVNIYRMRHEWDQAVEPIHRLYESPTRCTSRATRNSRGKRPMPRRPKPPRGPGWDCLSPSRW